MPLAEKLQYNNLELEQYLVYNFIWPLAKAYMQKPRIFTD